MEYEVEGSRLKDLEDVETSCAKRLPST